MVSQIQAERRWFTLMRLSFSAAGLSWLLLFLWALPGTPIGMFAPSYSAAMVLGLIFGLAALCTSVGFWMVWRPAFRHESPSEFARVLFGAGQVIRNRGQFMSRLALECRRAKPSSEKIFSVIVVRSLPNQTDRSQRERQAEDRPGLAAMAVRAVARSDDIVADIPPQEVWVLAVGAGDQASEGIVRRIAGTLASYPSLRDAQIGCSTFGTDGRKREEILAAAHRRLPPVADTTEAGRAA